MIGAGRNPTKYDKIHEQHHQKTTTQYNIPNNTRNNETKIPNPNKPNNLNLHHIHTIRVHNNIPTGQTDKTINPTNPIPNRTNVHLPTMTTTHPNPKTTNPRTPLNTPIAHNNHRTESGVCTITNLTTINLTQHQIPTTKNNHPNTTTTNQQNQHNPTRTNTDQTNLPKTNHTTRTDINQPQ